MSLLAGLHDREGAHFVPAGGWCVDTVALGENPPAPDYGALAPGVQWIVRLNWGYGSTGTLPPGGGYAGFAKRCADYARASQGCTRWIIGNEPNLPREWPNGRPISPTLYSGFYLFAREHIRQVPEHEGDQVLVAAPGPWNAEYKYPGNLNGDWIVYWRDVLAAVGEACDGFAVHAYTHGYEPSLARSDARMEPPFNNRLYEFRTFWDFANAVPRERAHLPIYITEANGDGPWQATGLMPAMLNEVAGWNSSDNLPKVRAVVFFRYPDYDRYGMASKPDVIEEFRAAAQGHAAPPKTSEKLTDAPQTIFLPNVQAQPAKRIWDMRLSDRGVRIVTPATIGPMWRVTMGRWEPQAESGGRHHIYVETVDEAGNRVVGLPLLVTWPGDEVRIVTEAKAGEAWAGNYPMTPGAYSIRVDDGTPSELVTGIQMGEMTPGGWNAGAHTSTYLRFERMAQAAPQPPQVIDPPTVPTQPQAPMELQAQGLLDPLVLEALVAVESGGAGFADGKLKVRVEAHLLLSPTFGMPDLFAPYFRFNKDNILEAWYRPSRNADWVMYHTGQEGEWAALGMASKVHADTAVRCASMGLGQVMGFHWRRLGYDTPLAMFNAMQRSEAAQLVAMINYVLTTPGLVEAINTRDWERIARLYNGAGLEHIYVPRLRAAYVRLGGK